MKHQAKSISAFIGAKDFEISRSFYQDLGFEESVISNNMSYFNVCNTLGFYLQDAYVKDWVDNTMIFVEVDNVKEYYNELEKLGLHHKYKNVRLTPIKNDTWGSECFLHDPSGILWHFGAFNK
jgi:catechol 2,3-dioxygenase-like lactoylglutathione lyase family enzyme